VEKGTRSKRLNHQGTQGKRWSSWLRVVRDKTARRNAGTPATPTTIRRSVEDALDAISRGEVVVVLDDEGREGEGDLIMAAEFADTERVAFFVRHTSGLICAAVTESRADELDLPLMVEDNTEAQRTAFTVTVDDKQHTTTGISAADRAVTMRTLVDPRTEPTDLARPGHVHVLRARDGGVLERPGHTEAAVDLARLAGLRPAGVLCEIVTEDARGMARRPDLEQFALRHDLVLITIAELIEFRRQSEPPLTRTADAVIPTEAGEFRCIAYRSDADGLTHLALVMGDPAGEEPSLVRVHSECLTGDVFSSVRCDCGQQLQTAMRLIAEAGSGVVVYLRGHEGRGIGISRKLDAYGLQDTGLDTVDANLALGLPVDARDYGIGAQVLADLGVRRVRLLTNNPAKRDGLEQHGIRVVEQVPIQSPANTQNIRYLRTKRERLGHLLDHLNAAEQMG
jgi:3,4-dihydroxy 2-butanone 4-phosphate synthase/GTP cyclohydrolase II